MASICMAATLLAGCGSGGATGPSATNRGAEIDEVAGVELYPLPRTVASACRRLGRKDAALLCPSLLPRPTRGFSSAAEIPDAFHVVPIRDGSGIAGISFSYSAEAGSPRLNQPDRFMHFDVQTRTDADRLPLELRAAKVGGIEGAYAPPRSRDYASEPYFANHARFFWRDGGTEYAATLHDFGPSTRAVLGAMVRSLVPASNAQSAQALDSQRVKSIPMPIGPVSLAPSVNGLWVAGMAKGASHLVEVDPAGSVVGSLLEISRYLAPVALASRNSAVWVAQRGYRQPDLLRLDAAGTGFDPAFTAGMNLVDLALDRKGDIWALDIGLPGTSGDPSGTLDHLNRTGSRTLARVRVGYAPGAVAVGADAIWVTNSIDGTVDRIDPGAEDVSASTTVGRSPVAIAVGAGSAWVANADSDTLSRIDPDAAKVSATIKVGRAPRAVTVHNGEVWVANYLDDTVARVNPTTGEVKETIAVGAGPSTIASAQGFVWVGNRLDNSLSRITP